MDVYSLLGMFLWKSVEQPGPLWGKIPHNGPGYSMPYVFILLYRVLRSIPSSCAALLLL